jgi:prepilin-type N-terminal cleavage/methylation domain-containing protein
MIKGNRGFTLLEVLIVVAIIVIIAGIAMPRFLGVSEQGKRAKASGDLRVLQTAMESYLLNENKLPAAAKDLEASNPQIVSNIDEFVDPFTKKAYQLTTAENTTTGKRYYALLSCGPNTTCGKGTLDAAKGTVTDIEADDIFVSNAKKA